MASAGKSRPGIIVLSGHPAVERAVNEAADSDRVRIFSCAYLAAAELLSRPDSRLIVDLCALPARHLPLLSLARKRHVRRFAFGTIPAGLTSEQLAGVELIPQTALTDTLADLQAEDKPAPSEAALGDRADTPAAAEPERDEAEAFERFDTAPQEPAAPAEDPLPTETSPGRYEPANPTTSTNEDPAENKPNELSGLLTPEELDALLGNEW